MSGVHGDGPVVFAYDGSDLARQGIEEAGRLLEAGGEALVVTVWQPFDVGFMPAVGIAFDAAEIAEVRKAAEETAAHGASLAEAAGLRARSQAIEATPIWQGIVQAGDDHDAGAIVLGSHGRTGLAGILIGSVAEAVARHSHRNVLIVHRPAESM